MLGCLSAILSVGQATSGVWVHVCRFQGFASPVWDPRASQSILWMFWEAASWSIRLARQTERLRRRIPEAEVCEYAGGRSASPVSWPRNSQPSRPLLLTWPRSSRFR